MMYSVWIIQLDPEGINQWIWGVRWQLCRWGYKKDFQKVIDYESYLRFAVYGDDVDDFFSYYRPFKCWLLLIHISYGCSSAISIHLDSLENAGVEHVMKSIDFSENLPDTVFF